ncbi:hypothetical protein PIB30_058597 [Stylosanthes scabra]|uniref:Uncharacterized protein n=1 Tax=Stylosanthes scabra TaxID=79078 RepID=A0ABU6VJD8_9FABA|nr:hypothetical protein [Stylosanthes scabra]
MGLETIMGVVRGQVRLDAASTCAGSLHGDLRIVLPDDVSEDLVVRHARASIMMLLSTALFGDKTAARVHLWWLPFVDRSGDTTGDLQFLPGCIGVYSEQITGTSSSCSSVCRIGWTRSRPYSTLPYCTRTTGPFGLRLSHLYTSGPSSD